MNIKKNAFKTIVAPEEVRQAFSELRNSLSTSDKILMQAIWNVIHRQINMTDALVDEIDVINSNIKLQKEQARAALLQKVEMVLTDDAAEYGTVDAGTVEADDAGTVETDDAGTVAA